MCGIVAYFSADGEAGNPQLVAQLARKQAHRGPDGQGHGTMGRAIVAHNRLAILDIANGSQPMHGEALGSMLVCNGGIYNHSTLRAKLLDHSFKTRSDSEAILHLYEELGARCAAKLDGTFAFFVSDGDAFVAARDALGIKPLYFGRSAGGGFLFTSELKAVAEACHEFRALPPGSLVTQSGEVERWFHPRWRTNVGRNRRVTPAQLRERLDRAVVKRLMSDVPVGVVLSSGLDSSLIADLCSRHYPDLRTFAVGAEGSGELETARSVAAALGTRHLECVYGIADAVQALRQVIYHLESYDPTLVRGAVPSFFLARLAAEHVKLVLTAEGANELFGGYDHFTQIRNPASFHHESVRLLLSLHETHLQRLDRMTMAHGLEARVPFLDVAFVEFAMGIDPILKLWREGELENGLLRHACSERLPSAVVNRRRAQLGKRAGAEAGLVAYAESHISDGDLLRAPQRFAVDPPRTKEELLYREIFDELFPGQAFRASAARRRPVEVAAVAGGELN